MTWVCEFCNTEFEDYKDLHRHLRTCKQRPFEVKDYSKRHGGDHTICNTCEYLILLRDEWPCSMCIHNGDNA